MVVGDIGFGKQRADGDGAHSLQRTFERFSQSLEEKKRHDKGILVYQHRQRQRARLHSLLVSCAQHESVVSSQTEGFNAQPSWL